MSFPHFNNMHASPVRLLIWLSRLKSASFLLMTFSLPSLTRLMSPQLPAHKHARVSPQADGQPRHTVAVSACASERGTLGPLPEAEAQVLLLEGHDDLLHQVVDGGVGGGAEEDPETTGLGEAVGGSRGHALGTLRGIINLVSFDPLIWCLKQGRLNLLLIIGYYNLSWDELLTWHGEITSEVQRRASQCAR